MLTEAVVVAMYAFIISVYVLCMVCVKGKGQVGHAGCSKCMSTICPGEPDGLVTMLPMLPGPLFAVSVHAAAQSTSCALELVQSNAQTAVVFVFALVCRRFCCCCPDPPLQCAESEKTSAGGVLLASDSGDRPNFGTVVAVGEGKKDEEGKTAAPNVSVGATVMYSKYSGTEFEVSITAAATAAGGHAECVPATLLSV